MNILFLLIIITGTCCLGAQEPMIHHCINDKVQPLLKDMLHVSDGEVLSNKRKKKPKRAATDNLRLHTVFHSSTADKAFFTSPNGGFQKATTLFANAFLVEPKVDKFLLQPRCKKTITSGINTGKCQKIDKKAQISKCGIFDVPSHLKGGGVECKQNAGSCKNKGNSGDGVDADFVLFAGAIDSQCEQYGSNVLAFAAVCGIDGVHDRPGLGYINICYKNILNAFDSLNGDMVYNILLHEMGHAFGFTSSVMRSFFRNKDGLYYDPVSEFQYNGGNILGLTSPQVLKYGKEYFNCPSLKYVPLENGGGSGSASSHWESRALYHELLTPFISPDYMVISNFTWAFFEDSGWYTVNYTYTNTIKSLELKWGKGLGCHFLTKPCINNDAFPYTCQRNQIGCTFDRISKGVCSSYSQFFDGCQIVLPTSKGVCIHDGGSKSLGIQEVFGEPTSRCYEHRSVDNIKTSASLACLNTSVVHHPNSGLTAYKLGSTSNSVWCEEGKHKVIDERFVYCPITEKITVQYSSIQNIDTLPKQLCHSDCMECARPSDPSQCITCQTGLQLDGPAPSSCCNPTKLGDCKLLATCTSGNIRLVGGSNQYNGNVEICSNGQWGRVCHNKWHTWEAIVVCRQLGFSLIGVKSPCCSKFQHDTKPPFLFDKFACNGREDTLIQCPHDNSQLQKCNDATMAGVQCTEPCENGATKIISYYGTDSSARGRVSVCHESMFKPVCDKDWNDITAGLYCKSLGFSQYGVMVSKGNRLHPSISDSFDMVTITDCDGLQNDQLTNCKIQATTKCPNAVAGIICQSASQAVVSDCSHGDLRLVGGETTNEGRVEVCYNKVWGTVCDYYWDNSDAMVACKQLGYSNGVVAEKKSSYGKGSGGIVFLNFLGCLGSEKKLINCSNYYYPYCKMPASVQCIN